MERLAWQALALLNKFVFIDRKMLTIIVRPFTRLAHGCLQWAGPSGYRYPFEQFIGKDGAGSVMSTFKRLDQT